MTNYTSEIAKVRRLFHKRLTEEILFIDNGIATNADTKNKGSRVIALEIAEALGARSGKRLMPQTSGKLFENVCEMFLCKTFLRLGHLRPGIWHIASEVGISSFEQYVHLAELDRAVKENPELMLTLGGDYIITPDIVVSRDRVNDASINAKENLVDDSCAIRSTLRDKSGSTQILHASISCKWTMRSDRAQNTRSEALNLIRNRKGRLPHIVVVTGEPLPTRVASIALGTGDVDCVYHFALFEFMDAVSRKWPAGSELLAMMVEGKRLKDISDLPLDMAI